MLKCSLGDLVQRRVVVSRLELTVPIVIILWCGKDNNTRLQTHWMRCEIEPDNFSDLDCAVFEDNHPNAMALSVLVTIEMLNAVNS